MSRPRPVLSRLLALLALAAWLAPSIAAPIHLALEAGEHRRTHGDDCALCQHAVSAPALPADPPPPPDASPCLVSSPSRRASPPARDPLDPSRGPRAPPSFPAA